MELNFKTYGQGPALIILHGLFGSLDNWVTHARQLSTHFTVYLVDQRNHGKSPHAEPWDYPTMAEDLNEFMDQQGIFQTHLLGHSMGGKTVMQFAHDYPDRIDRLIVADMAPKAYPPHHTGIIAALNNLNLSEIGARQEADSILKKDIPEPGVRQFLLKSLSRESDQGYSWKFNLEVITRDYTNVLEEITFDYSFDQPTLFIYGGKSHYVQPQDKEKILEFFPHATFKSIPQAGHWLHAEAPDEFIAITEEFLLG